MGLDLTIDGRDCPGCNSPARFCKGTRTDIQIPAGLEIQQFLGQLMANVEVGESTAVGLNGNNAFYLDVGSLSQINENKVLGLLSALSVALQKTGQPTNTRAAMTAAHEILSE